MYFSPTNQLKKFGDGDRRNRFSLGASPLPAANQKLIFWGGRIFSVY